MIIARPHYLNQLISSKGNRMIKIITGIRRCGKSFLLFELFSTWLKENGTDESHIIKIDLEDRRNLSLRNPDRLLEHIDSRMKDKEMYYILIDEVQHVDEFVDVLNSYLKVENADVYVTGSNSKFLSKDVATEFRGRGQDIHMYPLSFSEYLSVGMEKDLSRQWRDYMTYGGLPQTLLLEGAKSKRDYLRHLSDSVFVSDIVERNRVKNRPELEELLQILSSGIGSPCNPTKLSNTFKSLKNKTISNKTITNYLAYMCDAFMIEKALRYNIKGKKYINTLAKYYFTDIGLRNAILDFRQLEQTHIMENIIYNELLCRGFSVDVGVVEIKTTDKNGKDIRKQFEVDFVVNDSDQRYYIQSAFTIPDESKMLQESASFRNIDDSFKKIIVTKDNVTPHRNPEGYLIAGLFDFLLDKELLEKG